MNLKSFRLIGISGLAVAIGTLVAAAAGSAQAAAPKGVALCIGLDALDPSHYGGWSGELWACEFDANDMRDIAKSQGFDVQWNAAIPDGVLLTTAATRKAVLDAMGAAAEQLVAGDIFMISYSGHGGQVLDKNGDEKSNGPDDLLDETWCLYDGEMLDDELHKAFRGFKAGVRILMFSDSCHSGTVAKDAFYVALVELSRERSPLGVNAVFADGGRFASGDLTSYFTQFDRGADREPASEVRSGVPGFRSMPLDVAKRTWVQNLEFYEQIGTAEGLVGPEVAMRGEDGDMVASGLLISGCQDNQKSQDGTRNGAFTGALRGVWSSGVPEYTRSYRRFHQAIVAKFEHNPSQTPNYYPFGARNMAFEEQRPFTVATP